MQMEAPKGFPLITALRHAQRIWCRGSHVECSMKNGFMGGHMRGGGGGGGSVPRGKSSLAFVSCPR